ncbi:MAG: hypothetical protein QM773_13585 [Hyphomonadaceae bacterium]
MSLRLKIIIGVVAVAISVGMVLSYGFLHETLDLSSRTIGYGAALLLIAVVAVILWFATLRDWARRPAGSRARKTDKQRS